MSFAPPSASTFAPHWDKLYAFLIDASLVSCVLLVGGMIYFAVRYRRRSDNDKTAYISHNVFLEFLWSFVPFCIFMLVFFWGWWMFHEMRAMPRQALEVHVFAQKWDWEFRYKSGRKSIKELYVPVGEDVKLIMTSRDVIHSFFVPAFRIKQDVVPGKYTALWFKATKTGSFYLYCTEFCGEGHSQMLGRVNVLSRAAYDEWLMNDPYKGLTPVQIGQKVFNTKCMICHTTTTAKLIGPGFQGLWGARREFEDGSSAVVDENYIRESMLNPAARIVKGFPNAMVPQILSEDEVIAMVEYIKTL